MHGECNPESVVTCVCDTCINAFIGIVPLALMDDSVGPRQQEGCVVKTKNSVSGIMRLTAERALKADAAVLHSHYVKSV